MVITNEPNVFRAKPNCFSVFFSGSRYRVHVSLDIGKPFGSSVRFPLRVDAREGTREKYRGYGERSERSVGGLTDARVRAL